MNRRLHQNFHCVRMKNRPFDVSKTILQSKLINLKLAKLAKFSHVYFTTSNVLLRYCGNHSSEVKERFNGVEVMLYICGLPKIHIVCNFSASASYGP